MTTERDHEWACELWHKLRGTRDIEDWAEAILIEAAAGFRAPAATEGDRETAEKIIFADMGRRGLDTSWNELLIKDIAAALASAKAEAIREIARGQHPEWEERAKLAEAAILVQEKTTNDWRGAWDEARREVDALRKALRDTVHMLGTQYAYSKDEPRLVKARAALAGGADNG